MTGGAYVSCPRTFVFFRLMVSPKSLQACEKQCVNDWAWVATAASSANSMSLMRSLRTLVLAPRRRRRRACHLSGHEGRFLLLLCLRHVFINRPHKVPKSIGARTQPCLTSLRISNGSEKLPLNCTVLRVSMERLDHALQFGWATDLWENLKEGVSAD